MNSNDSKACAPVLRAMLQVLFPYASVYGFQCEAECSEP